MQETQVQSLGWEDPLEKEMATYSSIVAWEIPWTKEPGWHFIMNQAPSEDCHLSLLRTDQWTEEGDQ